MGRTYVRGHYRNKRGTSSGSGCFFRIIGIGIIILFALYLIGTAPPQVLAQIFLLSFLAIISFVIFRARKRKRQEENAQAYQQALTQQQAEQERQQMVYREQIRRQQISAQQERERQIQLQQQHARQVRAQKEQERLTRLKTLGDLLTLTPTEFEEVVGKVLEANGLQNVYRVGGSGDLGVDLMGTDSHGNRVLVQCKRYAPGRSIGTPDLQKFIGMMVVHHKAQRGIFVTTSTFKQTAEDLVGDKDIILIDGDRLVRLVQSIAMSQ